MQGVNCEQIEELHIFEFDGLGFEKLQSATKNENGEFIFKVKTNERIFRLSLIHI